MCSGDSCATGTRKKFIIRYQTSQVVASLVKIPLIAGAVNVAWKAVFGSFHSIACIAVLVIQLACQAVG